MKRFTAIAAPIIALTLILASCSSDKKSSTPSGATADAVAAVNMTVAAQPADKGQALYSLIDSATKSIDIVIYQIGGDTTMVNKLVAAMQKGVYVRTVMDGYGGYKDDGTGKYGFVTEMNAAMTAAKVDAKYFTPHWSSNNFNITHQKSVIIDAVDATGTELSPLPTSARLLISTGNFNSFITSTENDPFYAATDFYVTVTDPTLVGQASNVFNSDFSCAGTTVNNVDNGTQQPNGPLLWSNGSFGNASTGSATWTLNNYPSYPAGYPYPMIDISKMANQGNVANYQVNMLNSAVKGDIVRIYNEEFASDGGTNPVFNAVTAAAGRGVDVRVMLTFSDSFTADLTTVANAGATVNFIAPEDYLTPLVKAGYTGPTYIHGKAIMLSGSDGTFKQGYVGSTNLENASMFENRELGIAIGPSNATAANVIITQFDSDASWVGKSTASASYAVAWTKASKDLPAGWAKFVPSTTTTTTKVPKPSSPPTKCGLVTAP